MELLKDYISKAFDFFRGGDRAELQKDVSAQRSFIYNIVLCMEYNTENSDRQSTAFIVHTSMPWCSSACVCSSDLSPLRMHRAIKNGGALYVCWQDL